MTAVRTACVVLISAAVLGGCATVGAGDRDKVDAYRNALREARSVGPLPPDPCAAAEIYPDPGPGPGTPNAFAMGALEARECAVGSLMEVSSNYQAVRRDVMHLYSFYNRRAERQQTFMDMGSGITMVGAAGAFEGGISNSTRQAWAIAAFVPVVISQFNAYEPTRELFHGGALALQLITLRYDRYNRALTLMQPPAEPAEPSPTPTPETSATAEQAPESTPVQPVQAPICERPAIARDTADQWSKNANLRTRDPDGVLLAEARRLHTACLTLESRAESLEFTRRYADRLRPYLAADYAADVLLLDHAIVGKDRDLRFSPSETLGALIATPLRAADMLLTGENTKAALDGLKTQIAFSGLNRNLATIALPPVPAAESAVSHLSDSAAALGRDGAAGEVRALVQELHSLAVGLRDRQLRQDFELRLARDLTEAAGADYLTFAYDAVTNTTTVSLGPKPLTPALATANTGAGTVPAQ